MFIRHISIAFCLFKVFIYIFESLQKLHEIDFVLITHIIVSFWKWECQKVCEKKMLKLVVVIFLVIISLAWLYFLATEVPNLIPGLKQHEELSKFPSSIEDLKAITQVLSQTLIDDQIGFSYVLTLFTSAYLFKQTFAIPGSVFLNLLAGAIFGLSLGFPLTCFLTACGATLCYLLAKFAGRNAASR